MADRRELERLQVEIEALISDLWQVPRFVRGARQAHRPQTDCYRSEDPARLTVVVELPGVAPDEVEITAASGSLVIAGHRTRPAAVGRVQQMEIEYGPFYRHVPLPDDVDTADATATYSQGLLTVVLPIADQPREPSRVAIEVESRP